MEYMDLTEEQKAKAKAAKSPASALPAPPAERSARDHQEGAENGHGCE